MTPRDPLELAALCPTRERVGKVDMSIQCEGATPIPLLLPKACSTGGKVIFNLLCAAVNFIRDYPYKKNRGA